MAPVAKPIRRIGPLDIVLMVLLVTIAVMFIPAMRKAIPATVIVFRDGAIVARYPLTEPATFSVDGVEGPMTLSIADGGVAVIRAGCRNQICVHTGRIHRTYQQIVCAPNHVIVEISAAHAGDSIDAITQ